MIRYGFSKEIVECPGILHELKLSSVIYATGDLKGEAAERLSLMPASYGSSQFQKNRNHPLFDWMNKFKSNAHSYAKGICDLVSLGSTVLSNCEGEVELGHEGYSRMRNRKIFQTKFLFKRREVLECLPMLFVNHSRSYSKANGSQFNATLYLGSSTFIVFVK
ncbi:uncharacterized protein LOC110026042 isoform X2 [Phalaenopsis equestris]|uniref:uncharacterized protein LOC110026042 isoform X2 n=1 Tax=Phalaenopsis equestris TaxID=78828 RepID=UPI0009E224F7|nr:uncharacterized protein LOC110026042 isoform X2 [Phalaenopsis equestris]